MHSLQLNKKILKFGKKISDIKKLSKILFLITQNY